MKKSEKFKGNDTEIVNGEGKIYHKSRFIDSHVHLATREEIASEC
jgi:urease alpha subunit